MPKRYGYVFVLWADQFEEEAATIFITALRQAGWRVKVVGLSPGPLRGAHGLALVPDFTLGQALPLAALARGVIIPCAAAGLARLLNDPRLREFLEQARANGARFVLSPEEGGEAGAPDLFPTSGTAPVLVYPNRGDLRAFAQKLAAML